MWFADHVEPLVGGVMDDWGYAYRPVRGASTSLSNHAAGTAADHNATKHPLGVWGTFSGKVLAAIRRRLRLYGGCLRHGIDYRNRVDPMHVEINAPLSAVERRARRLMLTPRGRKLLKANPTQRAVILS